MKEEVKYIHNTDVHNLVAPGIVVPFLIEIFKPKSVIDIGCGIGTWLSVFKEKGITDILGVDGNYVDVKLLSGFIKPDEFKAMDLARPFDLKRKFDLAICLEVAEHLSHDNAPDLVETITHHADIVIFGAAIPNQWGQNHLNEQWPEYWVKLFSDHGYTCYDILRPLVWDNSLVDWWYRQNMLVFSKNLLTEYTPATGYLSVIHPIHFNQKIEYIDMLNKKVQFLTSELNKWKDGNGGIKRYGQNFLKALKKKFTKL